MQVVGAITGTAGFAINIDNLADFAAGYNATADEINVGKGSSLTLKDGIGWAADLSSSSNITNKGIIRLEEASASSASLATGIAGSFYNYGTIDLSGVNPYKHREVC